MNRPDLDSIAERLRAECPGVLVEVNGTGWTRRIDLWDRNGMNGAKEFAGSLTGDGWLKAVRVHPKRVATWRVLLAALEAA